MIIFDLKCLSQGHVFEAWFGSSDSYEDQRARGLLMCPLCGGTEIEKAVMAPRVQSKGNQRTESLPAPASGSSPAAAVPAAVSTNAEGVKQMLMALAAVQKKMLAQSENVGERFAEEARSIHLGETKERPIHGRATQEEAEGLIEEGIAVARLPFPVIEPSQKN